METVTLQREDGSSYRLQVEEKSPEWYDGIYRCDLEYRKPANESEYYPLYREVAGKVRSDLVFDVGCGTGQLASMVVSFKKGIDFSPVAIDIAKRRYPYLKDRFECVDMRESTEVEGGEYDCLTMVEVLEHIDNDLGFLRRVPRGKHIVFTVPSYYCESHLRAFPTETEVIDRYGKLVFIKEISRVNLKDLFVVFVVDGERK